WYCTTRARGRSYRGEHGAIDLRRGETAVDCRLAERRTIGSEQRGARGRRYWISFTLPVTAAHVPGLLGSSQRCERTTAWLFRTRRAVHEAGRRPSRNGARQ